MKQAQQTQQQKQQIETTQAIPQSEKSAQHQYPLPIPECVIKYRLQQRTGSARQATFRDLISTTDYWGMRAARLSALRQFPDRDVRVIKETYITHMVLAKEETLK